MKLGIYVAIGVIGFCAIRHMHDLILPDMSHHHLDIRIASDERGYLRAAYWFRSNMYWYIAALPLFSIASIILLARLDSSQRLTIEITAFLAVLLVFSAMPVIATSLLWHGTPVRIEFPGGDGVGYYFDVDVRRSLSTMLYCFALGIAPLAIALAAYAIRRMLTREYVA